MAAKKSRPAVRRASIPVVPRVARRGKLMLVRHAGRDYALVPLAEIERLEDEEDLRDALRAEAQLASGKLKPIPYEKVRREMGLD